MAAATVVIVFALLGLLLLARWVRQEEVPQVRLAAIGGALFGLVAAFGIALLTNKQALDAVAIGLLGAAVLPLVLMAQMRVIRRLITRR